jgi:hypothetical protein
MQPNVGLKRERRVLRRHGRRRGGKAHSRMPLIETDCESVHPIHFAQFRTLVNTVIEVLAS